MDLHGRSIGRRFRYIVFLALIPALSAGADTAGGSESTAATALRLGLEYYEDLKYEDALPLLLAALADSGLETSGRAQAGLHAAIIKISLGDEGTARRLIERVVHLAPRIDPPESVPPLILEMLDEARDALVEDGGKGVLIHEPPPPGERSARALVRTDADADLPVDQVVLKYRQRGETVWRDLEARRVDPTRFESRLPSPSPDSGAVEYYIEGFDRHGEHIASLGSASVPLVYSLPEEPGRRTSSRGPVFYAGLGTGSLSVVVGSALLGSSWRTHSAHQAGQPAGEVPTVTWSEAQAARRNAAIGVGLLAGGIAVTTASFVLPQRLQRSPAMAIVPVERGGMMVASFSWEAP